MFILNTEPIWTWSHFLFGLTYAIVASLIFLFIVLFFFKPKIRISPFLCRASINGEQCYIFKFVNVSRFSAHDITVELHKTRRIPMGGGSVNNEYKKLTLLNAEISHISAKLPFWEKDNASHHCVTVRSKEDVNKILSDESNGIVLRVGLKHGLTGLSKVFEQEYANVEDIKNGKFKPGTKFVALQL
jgi:hypothetical protein